MTLIMDAGAFVALERNDRAMWRRLESARLAGTPPRTHGGVVAQVWRGGGGRQALLARALHVVDTAPLDESLGRRAGVLLARTGTSDAVGAAVAALARDGDVIVTSDPDDLGLLVEAAPGRADVIRA
ncbi:MAG: twitching motility protein PilT [Ilumatobacteraceae bacterium]